jgi:hypothetical protein
MRGLALLWKVPSQQVCEQGTPVADNCPRLVECKDHGNLDP